MASRQSSVLVPFNASVARRQPKLGIELATRSEFVENPQLEASKPKGGGADVVLPVLWCILQGRGTHGVHLRGHAGGAVVFSVHFNKNAVAHIARTAGHRVVLVGCSRSLEKKDPARLDGRDSSTTAAAKPYDDGGSPLGWVKALVEVLRQGSTNRLTSLIGRENRLECIWHFADTHWYE
jgi:hypothetical protein